MKRVLIAIPTAKYIESATFKSIYDLDIPDDVEVTFQYFYGYRIDQIRNLIADWTIKGFDYLFAVDYDIVFPPDTLRRLLDYNLDIVSGIYIQRIPGVHNLEVFGLGGQRITMEILNAYGMSGLVEVEGVGFGCVLIKKEVFEKIGYPQFEYISAIDHSNTISEDTIFCQKAMSKGYHIYIDTNIRCDHIGNFTYKVKDFVEEPKYKNVLRELSKNVMSETHTNYLQSLKDSGTNPKIIYDIGSCILHWTTAAKTVWKDSNYYLFEAMSECEFLYKENINVMAGYNMGVLTNKDYKEVNFYQNNESPGGNSYYKENSEINKDAENIYTNELMVKKIGMTLDSIVAFRGFPLPDLIKMDVQGAEYDVLLGAKKCLENATDVILELQHVEYNKGAPHKDKVINYMESIGFELISNFDKTNVDGDYHFRKV